MLQRWCRAILATGCPCPAWAMVLKHRERGHVDRAEQDHNKLGVGQAEDVMILKRRRHLDTHITATDNLFDIKSALVMVPIILYYIERATMVRMKINMTTPGGDSGLAGAAGIQNMKQRTSVGVAVSRQHQPLMKCGKHLPVLIDSVKQATRASVYVRWIEQGILGKDQDGEKG